MDDTRTQDVPKPDQFVVGDQAVTVAYDWNYGLSARVCLPSALLRWMEQVFNGATEVIGDKVSLYRRTYVVVDTDGNELVSSPVPSSLQFYYDDYVLRQRREQNFDTLESDLAELKAAVKRLRESHLQTAELGTALAAADSAVANLYGYWQAVGFAQAQAALARVRGLIAELEGSFVTAAVRGLMSGSIYHRDVYWNRQVRERQLSLWIRVGGDTPLQEHVGDDAIDLLTDDRLAAIYTQMLIDAGAKTLIDVDNTPLSLDLETYAPEWLLEVPELEAAPGVITIVTSKKSVTTHVAYSLREDGGSLIPTGTATITLNEYKTARSIPDLTHGIELVLVLTVDGNEAVRGPVGDLLTKRVKAYRGGRQRSSAATPPGYNRLQPAIMGGVPMVRRPDRVRWR